MIALVGAILVHAILFTAMLMPQATPPGARATDGGEPGISVTMVRLSEASQQSYAAQQQAAQLEAFRQRLVSDGAATAQTDLPKPSAAQVATLLKVFGQDSVRNQKALTQNAVTPASAGHPAPSPALDLDPFAHVSVPKVADWNPVQAAVWVKVTHCWKPGRSAPKVKLWVAFDNEGGIAQPPAVMRDPDAKVDRAHITAEAEAIRAVLACAPYPPALVRGGKSLQLEFRNPDDRAQ